MSIDEQQLPVLDDPEYIRVVDARGMIRIVDELPEQCETAKSIGNSFRPPETEEPFQSVHLMGNGDNALACEIAARILTEHATVPVSVGGMGSIPNHIDNSTLVVLVDFLGKSPQAVSAYAALRDREVQPVCVSSGGKLSEDANAGQSKIFKVPPGQPTRSALGYVVVPIVAIVDSCGLAPGAFDRMTSAILMMKNAREELRVSRSIEKNLAKQCAEWLFEKNIYVVGVGEIAGLVAKRWKSQLNQNSKQPVCSANMEDDIYGPISVWEKVENPEDWRFILLKTDKQSPAERAITEAATQVLSGMSVQQIQLKGSTTGERLFYGCYLADYVSCYLAILYGRDPSVTEFAAATQEIATAIYEELTKAAE